jgi:hypothetical protein
MPGPIGRPGITGPICLGRGRVGPLATRPDLRAWSSWAGAENTGKETARSTKVRKGMRILERREYGAWRQAFDVKNVERMCVRNLRYPVPEVEVNPNESEGGIRSHAPCLGLSTIRIAIDAEIVAREFVSSLTYDGTSGYEHCFDDWANRGMA